MKKEEILPFLKKTFKEFDKNSFPEKSKFTQGKVRDIIDLRDKLLIVTTDRVSAFDRVLTTIPLKGEILNRISLYWFLNTKDIIENHVIDNPSPRSIIVKKCKVLPVEVVVRGYLTGSAWRDYKSGRQVSGISFPAGMKFNEKFTGPVITPSTKAQYGDHDIPISCKKIVEQGIIEKDVWEEIEKTAVALFKRGTELSEEHGLIFVDTKYEFGVLNGRLVLIDEIHTPDSSRFWFANAYKELFKEGKDQKMLDKEYLRQWLMKKGFTGSGSIPDIPDDIRIEVAWRYIRAFELILGEEFFPESEDSETEKSKILSAAAVISQIQSLN